MQLGCDAFRRAAVSRGLPISSAPLAPLAVHCYNHCENARPDQTARTRQKYYSGRYHVTASFDRSAAFRGKTTLAGLAGANLSTVYSRDHNRPLSTGRGCRPICTTLLQPTQPLLHTVVSFEDSSRPTVRVHRLHTSAVQQQSQSSALQESPQISPEDNSRTRFSSTVNSTKSYADKIDVGGSSTSIPAPMSKSCPQIAIGDEVEHKGLKTLDGTLRVRDPQHQYRVVVAARRKPIRMSDKQQVRRTRHSAERRMTVNWNSIRDILYDSTPRVREGEAALTLRGDPSTLRSLYERLRSAPNVRIVGSAPQKLGIPWFHRMSGPQEEIDLVREHFTKHEICTIDDWAVKEGREALELAATVRALIRPDPRVYASAHRISNTARALERIFEDKVVDPTSLHAFNIALSFLFEHEELDIARRLLWKWKELSQASTISCFNTFLVYKAKDQDLNGFYAILRRLLHEGLTPTWETWLAAFPLIPSTDAMQGFIAEMHLRGYMEHTNAAHYASRHVIGYSFGPFLDKGGSVSGYIEDLDALYGKIWHRAVAVHKLLGTLGERGRIQDAVRMLETFVSDRNYVCYATDINVILGNCARHLNGDTAVAVMKHAFDVWKVRPDRVTYAILFKLFRRARMYNSCRVVWKYACLQGQAGYAMRLVVRHSLEAAPGEAKSVQEQWQSSFGAVACGCPVGASTTTAREVFHKELELAGGTADRSLVDALVEALRMDKQWSMDGSRRGKDTSWKLQNAIAISISPPTPSSLAALRRSGSHSRTLNVSGSVG